MTYKLDRFIEQLMFMGFTTAQKLPFRALRVIAMICIGPIWFFASMPIAFPLMMVSIIRSMWEEVDIRQ